MLGFANLDGVGISGLEKYIDGQGLADLHGAGFSLTPENLAPITTSLDLKATYAVRDELAKGIAKFKAKSGAAVILDVNTGEVIAMASLPDYDPNTPADALGSEPYQPRVGRRLRDGLDLQGDLAGDGARCGQGQSQFAGRRARFAALRPLHHP